MNPPPHADVLSRAAAVIPALNEAEALRHLLPVLSTVGLGQIIVCDNGSNDDTRAVAEAHGATWVHEPKRGYGAACHAGVTALRDAINIVVFIDADQSCDADMIRSLVEPIAADRSDLVIGARVRSLREPGSATAAQRLGNWLVPKLVLWGWGHQYTDLGPFRAIRRASLEAMGLRDRRFGWTIEMQIRAVELGLRIAEVPIPHQRRRHGRGKISGTIRGAALAGYWIIRTCGAMRWTKSRRMRRDRDPRERTDGLDRACGPRRDALS